MLIFLHLPKTGGSTLTNILDWNYGDRTYHITRFSRIQTFLDLPDAEKAALPCLQGQIFYGIHQYIPQECTYLTVLRHPVERLISNYFHIEVRKKRLGEPVGNMSMEQLLEAEPFQAYMQANLIAGGNTIDEALRRPFTEETLTQAKANIERHFPIVGLLERYDESLLLMKRHFGWKRAYYARQNVSSTRKQLTDFPAATQKRILAACEPEMALFEYARQRLDDQIRQQGASFAADVAQLRSTNRRFQRMYHLAKPIRHSKLWFMVRTMIRKTSS